MKQSRFLILVPLLSSALFAAPAPQGCSIKNVEPGSSAEAAGLKPGDQIVDVSSQSIRTIEDLQKAVQDAAGTLSLGVKRAEKIETITAIIKPALRQKLGVQCIAPPEPSGHVRLGDQRSMSLYIGAALPQTTLDASRFGAGDERVGSAGVIGGGQFLNDFGPRMDIGIDISRTQLGNHSFDISGAVNGPTDLSIRSTVLMAVVKFHAPRPARFLPYALIGVGVHNSTLRWEFRRPPGAYSPSDSTMLVDDNRTSFAFAAAGGIDIDLGERTFAGFEGRLQYLGPAHYAAGPLGSQLGSDHFSGSPVNFNFMVHLGWKFGAPPPAPLVLP